MLVLGLDTSSPAVGAALVEVGSAAGRPFCSPRAAWQVVDARRHGELLATGIAAVLAESGADRRDVGALAVGVGPGPFTGLRVGIVTALALGHALGVPVYGAGSLDSVAGGPSGPRLVVTDARRREVYWARYDDGRRLDGPAVSRPDALVSQLRQAGWTGTVVGAGTRLYRAVFEPFAIDDDPGYPDPALLVRLVAERVVAGSPSELLTPLYLRRPDAVAPTAAKRVTA